MNHVGRLGGGGLPWTLIIAQVTQVILFLHLNVSRGRSCIVIISPREGAISYVYVYMYIYIFIST